MSSELQTQDFIRAAAPRAERVRLPPPSPAADGPYFWLIVLYVCVIFVYCVSLRNCRIFLHNFAICLRNFAISLRNVVAVCLFNCGVVLCNFAVHSNVGGKASEPASIFAGRGAQAR